MADYSEQQIKRLLILGSVSFALLLALLFGLYIWLELLRTEREVRTRLMDEAYAQSQAVGVRLRGAQILLSATRSLIEQQDLLDQPSLPRLQQLLQRQRNELASDVDLTVEQQLFVIDPKGRRLVGSAEALSRPIDLSTKGYFQVLRSDPAAGPQLGRLEPGLSGEPQVVLAVPLRQADDDFSGVLALSVPVTQFEAYGRHLQRRQGEVTTLFQLDGKPLFRDPPSETFIDFDLNRDPSLAKRFARMIELGRGSDRMVSPIDGSDRLFGFYRAGEYPLLAVVSQSYQAALKPWRNNLIHIGGLFIGLLLGMLVMLLLALRQLASIASHKQTERALRDVNSQLRDIQGMIDRFVILSDTDLKGTITYASDAFCNISGYRESELLGQSHRIVRHPDMPRHVFEELWRTIRSGNTWIGELQNRRKDGSSYWVEATIVPIVDAEGNCTGYRGIRQDISDKKLAERLAVTDHLTGLSNRSKLDQQLQQQISHCTRYGDNCALVMLDVDHFKQINDQFGHQIGDQVLTELSGIMRQRARETDTVGRWGGEEFLIIMPHTDLDGGMKLAEQLRQVIADYRFSTGQPQSASFGVSAYQPGDTLETMTGRADDALYRAKKSGRNRVAKQRPLESTADNAESG
ncbi:diguanylate cyclase [Motiliproteus sp.]|uniref:diguanylate cyclase n=1 Tax=Motiliproteus sp. TaxID=1898955 RepID=UPI003BACEA64